MPERVTIDLRGRRLRLRPVSLDDADALMTIRSHPLVAEKWLGAYRNVEEFREDVEEDDKQMLAVMIADSGRVVGMVQFYEEPDPDYRRAGIDLYVDPAFHRQGIATEALELVCDYLFDELGHHRIVIDPAVSNSAAIACYAGIGFQVVGRMRQYQRTLDGGWEDGLLMERLASDR